MLSVPKSFHSGVLGAWRDDPRQDGTNCAGPQDETREKTQGWRRPRIDTGTTVPKLSRREQDRREVGQLGRLYECG